MRPQNFKELVDLYTQSPKFSVLHDSTKYKDKTLLKVLLRVGAKMPVLYELDHMESLKQGNCWYELINSIKEDLSNAQKNSYRTSLKKVYDWGMKSIGIPLGSSPVLHIPILSHEPRETNPFTRAEIQVIKDYRKVTNCTKFSPSERLMSYVMEFLFETGMRPAEALRLNLDDIVQDTTPDGILDGTRLIRIIGAKGREQGKISRYVAVTPAVEVCIDWFITHRKLVKAKGSNLIVSVRGLKMVYGKLPMYFKRLMIKLGFKGKQIYDLRRGCATEIIHNPLYGITVAQKQLGHKNVATTMHYENLGKIQSAKLFKGHV